MQPNIRLKVSTPSPIRLRYVEAVTKPEVERTVTPTYEGVVVTPPSGATLSKVTIDPYPSKYTYTISENKIEEEVNNEQNRLET